VVSHLTKTEMSLVIWLNIVTIVAGCLPFARIHARRRPCHSSIALSMMVWSVHDKHAENAASVHNTCLDKFVCYSSE